MPVDVTFQCEHTMGCAEGTGMALFYRKINWPVEPQIGQRLMQSEADDDLGVDAAIIEVCVDVDELDSLNRPTIFASLDEFDINDYHQRMGSDTVLDKEYFTDYVRRFRATGWKLQEAAWWTHTHQKEEVAEPDDEDEDDEPSIFSNN